MYIRTYCTCAIHYIHTIHRQKVVSSVRRRLTREPPHRSIYPPPNRYYQFGLTSSISVSISANSNCLLLTECVLTFNPWGFCHRSGNHPLVLSKPAAPQCPLQPSPKAKPSSMCLRGHGPPSLSRSMVQMWPFLGSSARQLLRSSMISRSGQLQTWCPPASSLKRASR